MAKVVYLSLKKEVPGHDYWDMTFLDDCLEDLGDSDRVIIVIPGPYQGDIISKINKELSKYEKVLVIVTSDEENKFNVHDLKHPDMILYSQCGTGGKMFPIGYPPKTRKRLRALGVPHKDIDWFFSGQITHGRRDGTYEQLKNMGGGRLYATDGFTKGMSQKEYLKLMHRSKVVPCPSGAIVPASFRFYEALESGAIPLADDQSPLKSTREHYWERMFGKIPFPTYTRFSDIPVLMKYALHNQNLNNWVFAWWINQKFKIRQQFKIDLEIKLPKMVVIIPTSPISTHPKTDMIEEVIKSVRHHIDSPILITFDGIRKEMFDWSRQYQDYIRRMLWKCNHEYKDVLPVLFRNHNHQLGMMRQILKNINADYLLYMEHDTPLSTDKDIPFEKITKFIESEESNLVRLHFEDTVPKPHKHLMIGKVKDGFLKTRQWSQRPHVASVGYYRRIMQDHFSEDANCFIEDKMHSVAQVERWERHKLHIYHPDGGIRRSRNLDGRGQDYKFDKEQVF